MSDDSSVSPWSRAGDGGSDPSVEIILEPAFGAADPELDSDANRGPTGTGRRMSASAGTTIVVVLFAAVIGFAIGQVTAGESADAPATTEPEPADTPAEEVPNEPGLGDTLPQVSPDAVEEAARPVPRRRSDLLVVPSELDGIDLVALTADGDVLRIDGRTGDAELWPITGFDPVGPTDETIGGQLDRPSRSAVHLGDRVVIVDPTGRSNYVLDEHAVASPARGDLAGAVAIYPSAEPDEVWAVHHTGALGQLALRRTKVDESGTRGAFMIDGHFAVADHHGGLYVEAGTGTYHLGGNELTRISSGQLVGTGHHHVLVRHCDAAMDCELALIDRRTGSETPIEPPADTTFSLASTRPHRISPDGRLILAHQRAVPVIIDLDTGTIIRLSSFPDAIADNTWTPSGQLLYSLGATDTVYLRDPTTGTQTLDGFPALANIDIRTTP